MPGEVKVFLVDLHSGDLCLSNPEMMQMYPRCWEDGGWENGGWGDGGMGDGGCYLIICHFLLSAFREGASVVQ